MNRIIALDYGTKRCGIAITDPLQIIASGLTTVATSEVVSFLKEYCEKEEVSTLVVGQPKQMNNEPSESEVDIQKCIEKIQKELPTLLIERIDERFTSKMAFQTMIDSGLKKKQRQNKALIDEVSATIILQTYLERKP